ncbi:cadherin-like beta sandwich domain-containing protein [Agarilytica rhodophyticola]|uniref:cadherin-like beta sandwich domain-containing protein n=1 Tax=Agarilytica rhodophyticola TaxID=1737490 RepID=UPI000B3456DA|nr:cadherin-like beta sandwich domain-containing protein [Agarilytica rhodophyticola]
MFRCIASSLFGKCSSAKGLVLFVLIGIFLSGCNAGFGRSGDTDLERLVLSDGVTLDPAFRRDQLDYTARVAMSVDSITFNATPDDDKATMRLNGEDFPADTTVTRPLAFGRNTFEIEVIAENELTETYTIVITRVQESSSDASLSALKVEYVGLDFNRDTTSYTMAPNYFVNETVVTVTKSDELATATLGSQALANGRASSGVALSAGQASDLEVKVTASDGTTMRSYTTAVTRGAKSDLTVAMLPKDSTLVTGDKFGDVLAFDGNTLAIAATGRARGGSAGDNAGAVFVYFRTGDTWALQSQLDGPANGDLFGTSLALNGDVLAVGAPGTSSSSGAVHFYTRSGGSWSFDETITAPSGGEFGFSLDLDDDFLVVGAPATDSGVGAVYVYIPDSGSWSLEQTLRANGGRFGQVVQLNVDQANPEFVASAPNETDTTNSLNNAGAVYVYERNSSNMWSQEKQITPSVRSADDNFGASLAVLRNRIAVGVPGDDSGNVGVGNAANDTGAPDSGAAYVFTRQSQGENWIEDVFIKATQRSNGMAFGSQVALSASMLAVSAPMEDGSSMRISDDDDSLGINDSGAVYVFEKENNTWTHQLYVKATNTNLEDAFGSSLIFDGEDLIVGAENEDTSAFQSGAAYIIR